VLPGVLESERRITGGEFSPWSGHREDSERDLSLCTWISINAVVTAGASIAPYATFDHGGDLTTKRGGRT
jgi:hypothetical protein